jgi:biotin-dependent carboxylase-like uncharacterized protein
MIRDIGYLTIVKTGPGTSVQDQGRLGFSQYGVPTAGALDKRSFLWANHLLKNSNSDAAIEICQPGLTIRFDAPTLICLAGAKTSISLNGEAIPSFGIQEIHADDQVEIGAFLEGSILYLGIKNGFQNEKILSSRSWFAGVTDADFAKRGDQIPYFTNQEIPDFTASSVKFKLDWTSTKVIEAYPGPEWNLLDSKSQELIQSREFTISDLKNRMAIQLVELFPNDLPQMATSPVFPGTIQLTSGEKLLILMKDAQVTGGYPRVLQITQEALAILAQKRPNHKIRFRLKKLI